jgi:hypothetical protein
MCDILPHLAEGNRVSKLLENVKADIGVDGCVEEKWCQLCRYMTEHTTLSLFVVGGTSCKWDEDLHQITHMCSLS